MLRQRTAESVTEGHPDKLCDQIADTILDGILAVDSDAHAAIEVTCTGGECHVFGETTRMPDTPVETLARRVYRNVGHVQPDVVRVSLHEQSPEIRTGVGDGVAQGAGDQGVMVGYACDETPQFMPLPVVLAHMLTRRMDTLRHDGTLPWLGADGKSQVTVLYDDDRPKAVTDVLVSTQHKPDMELGEVRERVRRMIVEPVLADARMLDVDTSCARVTVNPAGVWTLGGPWADSGLTGRKLAVDQYGPAAPNGGGALSGKDPSKTDRSGAYMARLIAKTIVAAGLARRCTVTLAYMIGRAEPVQADVDTHGTGDVDDRLIRDAMLRVFDLTPHGIIRTLGLNRPMFASTAVYGHYGRIDLDLPWEDTSHADMLRTIAYGPDANGGM